MIITKLTTLIRASGGAEFKTYYKDEELKDYQYVYTANLDQDGEQISGTWRNIDSYSDRGHYAARINLQ